MVFHVSQTGRLTVLLAAACLTLSACSSDSDTPAETAAIDETAGEPAAAGAAVVPQGNQRAVVSDILPYAEVSEELVYGHFAFPSDMIEPLPAVILIHEWWGLDDTVKAAADRLAAEGYIVLAVDLFAGQTTDQLGVARELMLGLVENQELASANIQQAVDFVADTAGAPAIATLGWGLGGSWSLNAAMLVSDELDAAVIYYGQVSDEQSRLAPISVPILGFFGGNDRGVAVDDVRAFEEVMSSMDKDIDIVIYPDLGHGFANPANRNYDAELAERAWLRMLEFLADTLSGGS
ncbi:MAG: dienelactone hydrolase family protein [Pseudomonadota bacterium]